MKPQDLKEAQFGTNSYEMVNDLLWAFKDGKIATPAELEKEIRKITNRVRIETLAPFYNAIESQTVSLC